MKRHTIVFLLGMLVALWNKVEPYQERRARDLCVEWSQEEMDLLIGKGVVFHCYTQNPVNEVRNFKKVVYFLRLENGRWYSTSSWAEASEIRDDLEREGRQIQFWYGVVTRAMH